ncbi:hypothetical protein ABBQ38_008272 [Trebouxia sp. C0009 RCD-2024]
MLPMLTWAPLSSNHTASIKSGGLASMSRWPDGHLHSWSATVNSRSNGNGCPQCRGRKACKHNSLATKAPLVAAQWDYEVNEFTPDSVVSQSNQPVWWLCDVCDGKWTATPNNRVGKIKAGCPHCYEAAKGNKKTKQPTFAQCHHPLLAEWDHERNAAQGNHPDNVRLKSHKKIFWLCAKCPAGQEHSWSARPSHRTGYGKTGCPLCAGKAACRCNSLQAMYPDVAAEWDHPGTKASPVTTPIFHITLHGGPATGVAAGSRLSVHEQILSKRGLPD